MKNAIVIVLAGLLYLYLVFGFYLVHTTGSVAGLADIGNTKMLVVGVAALAVAAGARKK